jgi:uncharacterized protein with FMN-binding domain
MAQGRSDRLGRSDRKISNSLVAMSSAAVLAVYSAGYLRTRAAADRFATQSSERRPGSRSAVTPPVVPADPKAVPLPVPSPAASPEVPRTKVPVATPAAAEKVQPATAAPPPVIPEAAKVEIADAAPVVAPPAAPPIAPLVIPPIAPPPPPAPKWKDGTYLGWGTSRHGDIQASVVIEGGRITSATIAQCQTRYSCSVIDKLPPQVAQRQSPEVDYVSGATQSADAFYYGVVDALSKAK